MFNFQKNKKMINKLSIIIPVFNEEETIQLVLEKIKKVELPDIIKEIIIVNDFSKDNTKSSIEWYISQNKELDIKYLEHKKNKGKGAAIHSGIKKATGDYLIIQDADLEYDPSEYIDMIKPVSLGQADVVYGSRFLGNKPHKGIFFAHAFGNKFLTVLSNFFTNLNLTDMETCYKLFKTDILRGIPLKEKRFGFEPEVTAKISRIPKIKIQEVEISYFGRSYSEGKKIGWKDGFRAIYCILKYGLFQRN